MTKTYDATLGMHVLEVEITTRCNLNCKHCYNRTSKIVDLSISDILSLYEFANKKNVKRFVISGGEAVLHPNFTTLASKLNKLRPRNTEVIIQSNGLIGNEDIKLIKAFDVVHLSFEPDNSNVRNSSVKKTIELAEKLIAAGIRTYFFTTVHPGNIDKVDWMIQIANLHNIDIGFNLCISSHKDKLDLTKEQKIATIQKLYQLSQDKKILRFSSPFTSIFKEQKTQQYNGIKGGCTAGIAACVVLPNGDIIPCPFLRVKAGSIYKEGLEKAWLNSNVFKTLRNRVLFQGPCGSCDYLSHCGGCRAQAYNRDRNLSDYDPGCIL